MVPHPKLARREIRNLFDRYSLPVFDAGGTEPGGARQRRRTVFLRLKNGRGNCNLMG